MQEFVTLTIIGLLMIISPGPDFAIVTQNSLLQGRIAGLTAALGIAVANLCHVTVNLMGIGVIIANSELAFTFLKVLGASYLLFIGIKGIFAKPFTTKHTSINSENSDLHSEGDQFRISAPIKSSKELFLFGFRTGFITSLLNPKACLFYLSFFSVILTPGTHFFIQMLYGVWLSALALGWFLLVAYFFTNPVIGLKLRNVKHWIERFTGGALIFLGLRLLGSKAV